MLARFAGFEIRYQLFSPLFVVVGLIFFLLTFGSVTIDQIQIGSTNTVNVNSPYALNQTVLILSIFGLFIPTAFLANVVLRDRALDTEGLFFTKPVRETDYLLGRFVGAYAVTLLAFAVVPLAVFLGATMPWLDQTKVGPIRPLDYLYTMAVFAAPNLLITGTILFTVANLTRSNLATYTALVGFLMLYLTGLTLLREPSQRTLIATLDPFGIIALGEATRYWPPFELNTRLPPLEGVLIWNRALWFGAGLALVAFNMAVFRFRSGGVSLRRRAAEPEAATVVAVTLPTAAPSTGFGAALGQLVASVRYEIAGMLKSVTFWVLLALGMFNSLAPLVDLDMLYGTAVYPVTRAMIDVLQRTFTLVPYVVVIYYASELVWRDRGNRTHEIVDTTPTPSWAFVLSKLLAMWLTIAALFGVAILTAVAVQLAKGYTNLELGLYARRLLFDDVYGFYLTATLSIFLQVITNNRYIGMLAMVGYIIATLVLANLSLDHSLWVFAGAPAAPYSDMNGDGHFVEGAHWLFFYWTLFSGLLLLLTFALWNRGALTPIRRRLAALPGRTTPQAWAGATALLLAFAGVGAFVFYNTNVLNEYLPRKAVEDRAVRYEQKYGQYDGQPQPKITDVKVDVDIFPRERRYEARGTYVLVNKTGAPLDHVRVDYGFETIIRKQMLEGGVVETADELNRHYLWRLAEPMQPGEKRTLAFEIARENPGFRYASNVSSVVWNGTFINNLEAMPVIGFNREKRLEDRAARRRHHLEQIRLPKLEDEAAARSGGYRRDSDWVTFDTTVSTSPDQIAVAPGYLEREWTENGRRYFHYKMDAPITNFFSYLSARYAVREGDAGGVKLQVFFDPKHPYNVDRMLESMRDSLAYYDVAFGPYQFRQARIFEFPIFFGEFAQSFPNSIPYSEGIGFIADNRDPKKIDYVYYVTAHEIAHQWWGHQLYPAYVQGATMLSETFAQYSALMTMEHKYGPHQIRRFLKYELDRYLSSRGAEQLEELPLDRVENQQYIHYRKGSVAMYALKDYLGEETVNRALARFLKEPADESDLYPRTTDFLRILREEAGADPWRQELITDLFEKIVLFDLRATDLQVTERPDGKYDVKLTVEAKKLEADGKGAETEVPLDYPIDVGFFTKSPADVVSGEGADHVLFLEKRSMHAGENVLEVTLDKAPKWGGIDPYNKLVDRNSDDNLRKVDRTTGKPEKGATGRSRSDQDDGGSR
jgi:ABC-type transport system involved in multi-copper enzyme maturation permease subunit